MSYSTEDRFYLDVPSGNVMWIYHNPDAESGDQFVLNIFDLDDLAEARIKGSTPKDIFDNFIASSCKQYVADNGEIFYEFIKIDFEEMEPDAIGYEQALERLPTLYEAGQMIQRFTKCEYDELADFSDLENIGIACTETEAGVPVQVYADLKNCQLKMYLNDVLFGYRRSESLKDFMDEYLCCLDFSELVDPQEWMQGRRIELAED